MNERYCCVRETSSSQVIGRSVFELPVGGGVEDITERKRDEESLEMLAMSDSLTGLPNPRAFDRSLEVAMSTADRASSRVAVLYLDVDGFKSVNDSYGHDCGDRLLRPIAHRMQSCVGEDDFLARLSGDELAVIVRDPSDVEHAEGVAGRIVDSFSEPFRVDGHEMSVTASVGVSLFPDDGRSGCELVERADEAMYAATANGKNRFARLSG